MKFKITKKQGEVSAISVMGLGLMIETGLAEKGLQAISQAVEVATPIVLGTGGFYLAQKGRARYREFKDVKLFRVLPRNTTQLDKQTVQMLISQMASLRRSSMQRWTNGREWFRFVVHYGKDGIAFYVGAPSDRVRTVANAWIAAYPEAEVFPVDELPPLEGHRMFAVPLFKGNLKGLPFRTLDKGSALCETISQMAPGSWIDVRFSPGSWFAMKRQVKKALQAVQNGSWANDPDGKAREKAIKQRFTGREGVLEVAVTLGSRDAENLPSMAMALASAMSYDNGFHFRRYWFLDWLLNRLDAALTTPTKSHRMLLSSEEVANLVHLPPGDYSIMSEVPHLVEGERALLPGELEEGIGVGWLKHPTQKNRLVCIPFEQFTKHWFLSGQTGSGKSSTAVQMIQSIIDQWIEDPDNAPGFTYFDPAQETVVIILSRLLKAEREGKKVPWEKVHYFYLGPSEYPIGLNLLHRPEGVSPDVVARNAMHLIKYAYANTDTPKMDRLLENALLTLLMDERPHNLLGILPVLANEEFRNRIVPLIDDPIIQEFWKDWRREIANGSLHSLDSLMNRLSPLRTNQTMRRMFGQNRLSLDIRRYMDEGHIVLFDLLNVDKNDVKLAAGHIITQYHYLAKQRVPGSKLHCLMVDECHLVQIPIMEKIIAEDRKFGLSLGMITQYIDQLEKWLISAISENVGTILSCSLGTDSAKKISAMTNNAFDPSTLQNLPERTVAVYTKVKSQGRSTATSCIVESDPPYLYRPDGKPVNHTNTVERAKAMEYVLRKGKELQKRDGVPASVVDEEIREYLEVKTVLQTERTVHEY